MACPYCKQDVGHSDVGFTWWGGLIGGRLLHHVRCGGCGNHYNAKTGKPNTVAIAIYITVVSLLGLAIMYRFLR